RRSADAYDPQAKEVLAELYYLIFDGEMRRNCPVAGRAALEQVVAAQPADQELRAGFEAVFGAQGRLPVCARKKYDLRQPSAARGRSTSCASRRRRGAGRGTSRWAWRRRGWATWPAPSGRSPSRTPRTCRPGSTSG